MDNHCNVSSKDDLATRRVYAVLDCVNKGQSEAEVLLPPYVARLYTAFVFKPRLSGKQEFCFAGCFKA